jgi:flagellar motor component MotA
MIEFVAYLKSQRALVVNLVIALIGVLTAIGLVPVGFVLTPEQVAANFDKIAGAIAIVGAIANFLLNLKPKDKTDGAE